MLAIKAGRQSLQSSVESSTQQTAISSNYQTITAQQPKQGSSEWHDLRVGKITSSKIPSLIGLYGINEYKKAWACISQKYRDEIKSFPNFERGKFYEPITANAFENASGIKLSESPLILLPNYPDHYGASSDRLFEVNSFFLKGFQTDEIRELTGKYILEIKTCAIGSLKPLERVTASYVCQCQLQMSCMPEVTASLLMSYLPETEEFTLFLIKRDKPFTRTLFTLCNSLISSDCITCFHIVKNEYSSQLSNLAGNVPDFIAIFIFIFFAKNIADQTDQFVFLE